MMVLARGLEDLCQTQCFENRASNYPDLNTSRSLSAATAVLDFDPMMGLWRTLSAYLASRPDGDLLTPATRSEDTFYT
jgi:hypothetical protein